MEKNKTMNIRVIDAIILCQLVDEYQEFNQAFMNLLGSEKNQIKTVADLSAMSRNAHRYVPKKIKEFYNEYKFIIDTIVQNSDLQAFLFFNYRYGAACNEVSFKNIGFYQYLLFNNDKTDKILAVLERLKSLGFIEFELNQMFDFSKEVYKAKVTYFEINGLYYLDNLEPIPEYERGVVKYKTSGSPYKMELRIVNSGSLVGKERIRLNSLTFDADKLPKKLSGKDIYDEIIGLPAKKRQEYTSIRNSVDLSVGVQDLEYLLNKFNETVTRMESVDSKEQVLEELRNMQQGLSQIQTLSAAYNRSITEGSSYITPELLQEEAKKYIIRREKAKKDWY